MNSNPLRQCRSILHSFLTCSSPFSHDRRRIRFYLAHSNALEFRDSSAASGSTFWHDPDALRDNVARLWCELYSPRLTVD